METTNGIIIVERIDEKLKSKGENRTHIARALGIKPQTIAAWYARGTVPAADTAIYIARYLNVSVEWLILGEESQAPQLTPWQKELLEACAPFDQRDKEDLLQTARAKSDRYTSSSETKMA